MKTLVLALAAMATLGSCSSSHSSHDGGSAGASGKAGNAPMRAVAQLSPASGSQATGTITFVQQPDGVAVHAHVEHLTPGAHGFHIHDKGDCSAPDASSAGGHFDPDGHPHGDRTAAQRHEGDLGNLDANAAGTADVTFVDATLSFTGSHSIVGRAVIVHAGKDDFTSQPSGNSGARVACGVIESD